MIKSTDPDKGNVPDPTGSGFTTLDTVHLNFKKKRPFSQRRFYSGIKSTHSNHFKQTGVDDIQLADDDLELSR